MTDDMMNLRTLVEKTPDADLLREMIGFAAQRLMELEVESETEAAYGEKTHERLAARCIVTTPKSSFSRAAYDTPLPTSSQRLRARWRQSARR